MKVLLIQPKVENPIKANNPTFVDETRGINPSIGLMYMASYLLRYTNHTINIFDGQLNDSIDLIALLMKNNYDVVGISVLTFTLIDAINTIKLVRRESPMSKIVVGGTHPTIYPQEMLKWADFVIRGEGEQVLPIVLDNLNSKQRIFGLKELEQNLDKYPFPYRTRVKEYNSIFSKGCATTIITSRGCPFQCTFCYRPVVGKTLRMRTTENVVNEIVECVNKGIGDFQIYDDTFTVNTERVGNICKEIINRKLKIRFDVRTRVDMINIYLLELLRRAGMVQIRFGIESGNQRVLDRMQKEITLQQIKQAFLWCKELNIETIGYIMLGNPGETREDINDTINLVNRLKPDFVHCAIFTLFPGTQSYEEWLAKGNKDVWKEFATNPTKDFQSPVWGDIPREELEQMVMKFYKDFYLRLGYIMKHIWKNPIKYIMAGLKLMNKNVVTKG